MICEDIPCRGDSSPVVKEMYAEGGREKAINLMGLPG
jgi:hypothetical protein